MKGVFAGVLLLNDKVIDRAIFAASDNHSVRVERITWNKRGEVALTQTVIDEISSWFDSVKTRAGEEATQPS